MEYPGIPARRGVPFGGVSQDTRTEGGEPSFGYPGILVRRVTSVAPPRYARRMSIAPRPSNPSVAIDPVQLWIEAHLDELRPHVGKQAAIDPVRGLLAVGANYGEVADQLDALGVPRESGVVIGPVLL